MFVGAQLSLTKITNSTAVLVHHCYTAVPFVDNYLRASNTVCLTDNSARDHGFVNLRRRAEGGGEQRYWVEAIRRSAHSRCWVCKCVDIAGRVCRAKDMGFGLVGRCGVVWMLALAYRVGRRESLKR